MADREPNNDQEKEEKGKSSSGKLLQVIIIVLLVAALGLGGFIAWKLVTMHVPLIAGQKPLPTRTTAIKLTLPTIIVPLKGITVNLADAGENRYLHIKIKLSVEGKADKAAIAPFTAPIMDLVITTLSSKTVKDISSSQGKFALKEELAYRINKVVGKAVVKRIYFSDFVIQ